MASPTSVTLWGNHIHKRGNFGQFLAQKMSKTNNLKNQCNVKKIKA